MELLEKATAVLELAREGDFLSGDLPEQEGERIELAAYYAEEADKFARACESTGTTTEPIVLRILETWGETSDGTSVSPQADRPEGDPVPQEPKPVVVKAASEFQTVAEKEKLPVPAQIEGDATPLPNDMTLANDKLVRRLHGERGAFLARATWLLSQASISLKNAEHLRDDAFRRALSKLDRIDPDTEKPKLKVHLDAEAQSDPEWLGWDAKVREHEAHVEELKALREIYAGDVSRLSREMSMRNEEFARSGGRSR